MWDPDEKQRMENDGLALMGIWRRIVAFPDNCATLIWGILGIVISFPVNCAVKLLKMLLKLIVLAARQLSKLVMGQPKGRIKVIVAIAAAGCFAWWVWPTPWRILWPMPWEKNVKKDYELYRVNRFTGEPWLLDEFGWVSGRTKKRSEEIWTEVLGSNEYGLRSWEEKDVASGKAKWKKRNAAKEKIKKWEARRESWKSKEIPFPDPMPPSIHSIPGLNRREAAACAKSDTQIVVFLQLLREECPRDWDHVIHPSWVDAVKEVDKEFGGDAELYREAEELKLYRY